MAVVPSQQQPGRSQLGLSSLLRTDLGARAPQPDVRTPLYLRQQPAHALPRPPASARGAKEAQIGTSSRAGGRVASQSTSSRRQRYHACMRADSFARPTTQHTLPCPRHSCCYDWLTQAVLLQVPFARSRSRCLPNPISATWRRQSVRQNTERTAIGYSRYALRARPRTDLLLMPTTLPSVRC